MTPLRTCERLMCVYLQESLHSAFHAAKVYSRTLERFRLFYKDNEALDLDLLRRQDHGTSRRRRCRLSSECDAEPLVPWRRFVLF